MEVNFESLLVILNLINIITCNNAILKAKDGMNSNEKMCDKFGSESYFSPDMVVGQQWRIYYTWHWKLDHKCMDLRFKHATSTIVDRFHNDMYEYLDPQPSWSQATLHLSMGKASHEMLLFADRSTVGRLRGVSNIIRDGNLIPTKQGVPLLEFQLKLIRDGKFLVMMDCKIGVITLSARHDEPPFRAEIEAAVAELDLDGGSHACLQDKNKNEHYVLPDEH